MSGKPIHIVFLAQPIHHIPPRGAAAVEWWTWQVARKLAMTGRYTPHIICTGEGDAAPEEECIEGVFFKRITLSRVYKRLFKKWTRFDPYGYADRAIRYIRSVDARIVHTQNSPSLHQYIARKLKDVKTVLHLHNQLSPDGNCKADKIVTVSSFMADWCKKYYPGLPVDVVTNGVDEYLYADQQSLAAWRTQLPADAKVLMYAGRISAEKGIDLLAKAFARIAPQHPNIYLVLVGARSHGDCDRSRYADRLEAILAPVQNQVRFIGSVLPDEMPRHYKAADLLIIPSLNEPFGMVCLEAMASGIAVLASPKGGLPEFVQSGVTGFLIEDYGNEEVLSKQILALLNQPEKIRQVGEIAQSYALGHHDWCIVASQLSAVYDQLMEV